jgi:pimeloyl-ACP methyl ester carboxylesterase
VIVNGALSVRTFSFATKMAQALSHGYTVYNYDRRGRGESTDHPDYSVQREVEDVAAVCKAAGGKPYVVGLSSGAALALEAAAAGIPMAGLYAYEPPYTKEDASATTDPEFRVKLEAMRAAGQRDEAVKYFMRTVGVPGVGIAIMRLLPMWKVMRGVAHTLPYDAAVMDGFAVPRARFAKIKASTTVAHGAKTAPALKVGAKAAADGVPGARFRIVPRANHGVKAKALLPELNAAFGV